MDGRSFTVGWCFVDCKWMRNRRIMINERVTKRPIISAKGHIGSYDSTRFDIGAFKSQGLGDWVETWAKPIARWLDARRPVDPVLAWLVGLAVRARLVTLPLAGCSACSKRRRWLNQLLPDLRRWASWRTAPRRLWAMLKAA